MSENAKGKHTPKEEQSEKKSNKLDKTKQSEIKEKVYTTKQVETSVTLIDSPEADVVLEALLFISKYADINKNNLAGLVKSGLAQKLMNNWTKNICILRLSLRLLTILLNVEEGLYEIDQNKYDDQIISIANMYMEHKDSHVKEFAAEILAKIASSCRVSTLIFKVELLIPIFENMKNSKNVNLLYHSMLLFCELIEAPAAVSALAENHSCDLNIIAAQLSSKDDKISDLALNIFEKLSRYGLPFVQDTLRNILLMEKMFRIIMNDDKEQQHAKAIQIVQNCLNSNETSSYFIESIEFIELCQWVKTCHPKYLLPLIEVFIKLTGMPELKQILFDLSVEESILFFFRYKDKQVLNKTCMAVSNMTTHKYCCEAMLTPVVAGDLIEILQRQNDAEDPNNEIALKAVFFFIRRNIKALDIFLENDLKRILLDIFYNKMPELNNDSIYMILEILYKCLVHPKYQEEFATEDNLSEILKHLQSPLVKVATICCEIMSSLASLDIFRRIFMSNNGPKICVEMMRSTEDINLLTQILYLIFSCLIYEDMAMAFLHNSLLTELKNLSDYVVHQIPFCNKVKCLALNYYPPIKFYETGLLEITNKLPNKFYIINGQWNGPFPFLGILEMMKVSPYPTIYIVDYSYEVQKGLEPKIESQVSLRSSETIISSRSMSSTSRSSRKISLPEIPSAFDINYGNVSNDVFLPRYIYHIQKYDKFLQGPIKSRIKFLSEYVDTLLCGSKPHITVPEKIHEYKLHIQCLKHKLGNNIIPIGFLRLGFHCEKSLLFKALADKICIPCSLVKGSSRVYWNEVALFENIDGSEKIRFYVVDLIDEVGELLLVGSREANKYCNIN